jgi:hypothetical protein
LRPSLSINYWLNLKMQQRHLRGVCSRGGAGLTTGPLNPQYGWVGASAKRVQWKGDISANSAAAFRFEKTSKRADIEEAARGSQHTGSDLEGRTWRRQNDPTDGDHPWGRLMTDPGGAPVRSSTNPDIEGGRFNAAFHVSDLRSRFASTALPTVSRAIRRRF